MAKKVVCKSIFSFITVSSKWLLLCSNSSSSFQSRYSFHWVIVDDCGKSWLLKYFSSLSRDRTFFFFPTGCFRWDQLSKNVQLLLVSMFILHSLPNRHDKLNAIMIHVILLRRKYLSEIASLAGCLSIKYYLWVWWGENFLNIFSAYYRSCYFDRYL